MRNTALFLALLPLAAAQAAPNPWLDPSRFAVGLKYTGLSYHPGGGENEEPYKRALDSKDFWVLLVGLQADADYVLHRFVLLRASTSLYRDCADVWAGYYHFAPRLNLPIGRFAARIGVGPTLLWRENWLGKVKGYEKDSFFGPAREETFQSKFIWYGGDVEFEWKGWDRVGIVYSMIPGFPEVVQQSIGARMTF